jgi:two-component system, cell cycle sensor histidine kinase PleC
MFSYLRYFSIISFFVVVIAAVLLGFYFRSIASKDLADVAEKSSISLAQGYINTTWKTHLPNIKRLSALDTAKWKIYKEFVTFSEDTFRHFEGVPVTQLNIYTPSGEQVLSVNQDAEIRYTSETSINALPADSETRQGFAQATRGEPYSRIIEDSEFRTPSGETANGAVVQTFVPIMPESYTTVLAGANIKIDGVIEVFYDITPQWSQLYLFQMIGTGGILVIFVTLIGALFFTSKKAESIISAQHEANVELAATAAKAEAESRQKSQFLANVSHELRTPLNAIIGFSEIIKNEVMGALANETYMNYIKDIHSSGVHLLSLINDILDFSKAEAGKLELHLSELDATKLIQNCMRLVSPRAEQAQVNLITELPNEHFIITGDAKKLKQVLLNLLSNAVKFTPEGGEVKVVAWQNVMDDSIAIEVRDTGIGIAPKDISRAMSPFGQVDSALSRKYEGTGLGLPLTKKFVEIMGGTFRIESEVDAGTTITITIPLTPPKHVLSSQDKARESDAGQDGEAPPREKQVSPGLMQFAEQNPMPNEAAAPLPKPKSSLLSSQSEQRPQLVQTTPPAPAPAPTLTPTPATHQEQPLHHAPAAAPLQPMRPITAGGPMATPPPAPEPSEPEPSAPATTGDNSKPAFAAAPALAPLTPVQETAPAQAPAPAEPSPAEPAPQPAAARPAPIIQSIPAAPATPPIAMPAAAPQETPPQGPPQEAAPPVETHATAEAPPATPSAEGGNGNGQKFMSYADLKRMAQPVNPEDGNSNS